MPDHEGLVVASNRGPVSWQRGESGELTASRGFGGLVTALGGALQQEPGTWVSVAMDDDDRAVAAEHFGESFDVDAGGSTFNLRLLDVGDRFHAYYNDVSNRLLWFTVHGLWDAAYEPSGADWSADWDGGYLPVNEEVAAAVVEAATSSGTTGVGGSTRSGGSTGSGRSAGAVEVYLQDYHLCATPRAVRDALPDAAVLHYLHTPWAEPDGMRLLPDRVVDGVLRGLLGAHVIGFSAPAWARAFRNCAAELLGADVDGDAVTFEGHRTVVTDFVLGVDSDDLANSAASDAAREAGEDLDNELDGRTLLLRVDRTDLSKNILRGLLAYETLLERHPEHRERVWHYAHLNPSRQGVPEYQRYLDACREATERIQERFGEHSVTMFVGDDYPKAVAALQRYDVLLANPVRDGTNLVAKEGPALNTRDGALVLSWLAGAATALDDAAIMVNPFDVEEQAQALHAALTMDAGDRAARAKRLSEAAREGAPEDWFQAQREALRAAVGRT